MKSFKFFIISGLVLLFTSEMIYDFIKIYSDQSINISLFDDSESKETEKDDDIEKDKLNPRFLIFSTVKCANSVSNNIITTDFILLSSPQLEITTPPPDYYFA